MSLILNRSKLCVIRCALNYLPSAQRSFSRTGVVNNSSKTIPQEYERDPQPVFTDPETQNLLKSMTQLHIDKVFRKTAVQDNSVEYKFMTTEQLEEEFQKTLENARRLLDMPPVVQIKEDKQCIISKDTALKGFSDTKFVFTDTTFGLRQSERKVVVRQIDGTLEHATLALAKRMNQLYFPMEGRKLETPRMFEEGHLARCLDEQMYEFILDRLILQFEPYERAYHHISSRVYEHLNETKEFDKLRSTRHFGPMAFYYAWHRTIDDLLYDMIRRDYLLNGAELITLMYKIHGIKCDNAQLPKILEQIRSSKQPALDELRKSIRTTNLDIQDEIKSAIGKSLEDFQNDDLCLKFIEQYISEHALKKVQLELAVQTLREINTEKRQLYEGLNKAHGVQH